MVPRGGCSISTLFAVDSRCLRVPFLLMCAREETKVFYYCRTKTFKTNLSSSPWSSVGKVGLFFFSLYRFKTYWPFTIITSASHNINPLSLQYYTIFSSDDAQLLQALVTEQNCFFPTHKFPDVANKSLSISTLKFRKRHCTEEIQEYKIESI